MMIKNRISYTLIILLFISFACARKTTATEELTTEEGYVKGKITTDYESQGCPYLINTSMHGEIVVYAAINLDDKLKQEGKEFLFKYRPIRSPRKGICKTGTYIYIEEFKEK